MIEAGQPTKKRIPVNKWIAKIDKVGVKYLMSQDYNKRMYDLIYKRCAELIYDYYKL